jgi:hypothetical protein
MTIRQNGGIFGRSPTYSTIEVEGDATLGKANVDNISVDGNSITATSGDLTLDATSGVLEHNKSITSNDKRSVKAVGKSGTASTAVAFTAYTVTVTNNSMTKVEVDLAAIEQTGYIGAIARKYVFSLRQRSSGLTASAVTDASDHSFSESNSNYSITPTIAVNIVDGNNATVDITLTKGGAIGWSTALYHVDAKLNSVKNSAALA